MRPDNKLMLTKKMTSKCAPSCLSQNGKFEHPTRLLVPNAVREGRVFPSVHDRSRCTDFHFSIFDFRLSGLVLRSAARPIFEFRFSIFSFSANQPRG
jgi:hypothetical protein